MNETKNVVICGVGGQGIILASDILSSALFLGGYDVKKNEIHGMSQREGAVISFIRYGDKVYSPTVEKEQADYLLSFEKLEALRNLPYLKQDGCAIVNVTEIHPTPVILGVVKYPEDIEGPISKKSNCCNMINALDELKVLKTTKAVNVLLLGVLSSFMPEIEHETWMKALEQNVKPAFLEMNQKAFEIGRNKRYCTH